MELEIRKLTHIRWEGVPVESGSGGGVGAPADPG